MSGPVDNIHNVNERLIEQLAESNRDRNSLRAELKGAQESRDNFRKALEDAPHAPYCISTLMNYRDRCDCWKSRALNQNPAQPEKP